MGTHTWWVGTAWHMCVYAGLTIQCQFAGLVRVWRALTEIVEMCERADEHILSFLDQETSPKP